MPIKSNNTTLLTWLLVIGLQLLGFQGILHATTTECISCDGIVTTDQGKHQEVSADQHSRFQGIIAEIAEKNVEEEEAQTRPSHTKTGFVTYLSTSIIEFLFPNAQTITNYFDSDQLQSTIPLYLHYEVFRL